jgi:NAD(P)-dependent dehydrogenase (short-subunit alcohol dehydrogenase family)
MPNNSSSHHALPEKAWVITGPTSGIGRRTALELAKHGTVVLVGRNASNLSGVEADIQKENGAHSVSVVCDFADISSVRRAAADIISLDLRIAGLVNNAGVVSAPGARTAQGWDATFATNHLGPFAFTDALIPNLPDGTNVVFICSGVEDPERRPAVKVGYRGGRYISAEASARGEWKSGGSTHAGYDAYATSEQCNLATVLAFARETPRLRFNAVEPGFNPGTNLAREAPVAVRLVLKYVLQLLAPFITYWSTPKHAAQVITKVLTDESDRTGMYFDENGEPMLGSAQVRDPAFAERVAAETRALLSAATSMAA